MEHRKRLALLDSIRGLTLISMMVFHACWDLMYIFGVQMPWYESQGAYIWQQSICWSFIFLSGFCWSLGRKPLKRGLIVFGSGLLVTVVTVLFMPEDRVVFGVLTLIGSSMLLMIVFDKILRRIPGVIVFLVNFLLFVLTRNINTGTLGFESWRMVRLPITLYRDGFMTYLGFCSPSFFSTDYFSLIPWLFLFLSGYGCFHMISEKKKEQLLSIGSRPLSFLGRNSLWLYLLHQPMIYLVLLLLNMLKLL